MYGKKDRFIPLAPNAIQHKSKARSKLIIHSEEFYYRCKLRRDRGFYFLIDEFERRKASINHLYRERAQPYVTWRDSYVVVDRKKNK